MYLEFSFEYEDTVFPVKATYYPGRDATRYSPAEPAEAEFECLDLERLVRKTWTYYDFCEFVSQPKGLTYGMMVEQEVADITQAIVSRIEEQYRRELESYQEDKADAEIERRRLRLCD